MTITASDMRVVATAAALNEALSQSRSAGQRVGFVPTMGALHEGHLSLVDEARRRADVVVMSIFVNPLQFGPTEDLGRYPRDPEGDAARARSRGVDVLFLPAASVVYPHAPRVRVSPGEMADRWEGASRPGHFEGVLTVVAKLFNLVRPDVAVFGQKDAQQAALVRAMASDLDFPIDIVIAPTVRETDGLALSSRNRFLSPQDRARALVLSRTLFAVDASFREGEHSSLALQSLAHRMLAEEPEVTVEYLALIDPERLEPVERATTGTIVAIAARVGTTRLIDNVVLAQP